MVSNPLMVVTLVRMGRYHMIVSADHHGWCPGVQRVGDPVKRRSHNVLLVRRRGCADVGCKERDWMKRGNVLISAPHFANKIHNIHR